METETPPSPAATRGGRHPWLIAMAVLLLGLIVLLVLWDWNWFKRPIERYVEAKTGRHLVIGGNLAVHLGRTTTVQADRVAFGN
ncbi:MAG: AsmA family protein, partial [Xanthomonadaceae bacterium]|nr:AsmA family protein [Xanthomonadaceae bacterium]